MLLFSSSDVRLSCVLGALGCLRTTEGREANSSRQTLSVFFYYRDRLCSVTKIQQTSLHISFKSSSSSNLVFALERIPELKTSNNPIKSVQQSHYQMLNYAGYMHSECLISFYCLSY